MKITLTDYQFTAANELITAILDAFDRYRTAKVASSIPLIAPTGAGKTVIAAAALEALFAGSSDFDVPPLDRLVVLWFSHDPELNEQSRRNLEAYSDVLNGRVKTISSHFSDAALSPGHVYTLNAQKLAAGNHLVRETGESSTLTMYEIIANTLRDEDTNMLFIIDEAHQGQREAAEGKVSETIVSGLINGRTPAPAMPVVLGMSATAKRFQQAMHATRERLTVAAVEVPVEDVQASGLLKDTIVIDTRGEDGHYDTSFIQLGTERLRESTVAWSRHSHRTGDKAVVPLMVVQLPSTPTSEDVAGYMDTILAAYPDLDPSNFAHARQSHSTWDLGRHKVAYINPSAVQDATNIRVLFVQEAVTTGWDCPRAEVMVSLRSASEHTYITQLVGRLLRTPLARRIDGDDTLNAAFAVLPRFDTETLNHIVRRLEHGSGEDETHVPVPGRSVVINPVTLSRNTDIDLIDEIVDLCETLPSYRLPRVPRTPLHRVYALASELALDFPESRPYETVDSELCDDLERLIKRHKAEFDEALHDILHVDVATTFIDRATGTTRTTTRSRRASNAAVARAFRDARRTWPTLAKTYADYLIDRNVEDVSFDDKVRVAEASVAAATRVRDIVDGVRESALGLVKKMFDTHGANIRARGLREKYDVIKLMSDKTEAVGLSIPSTIIAGRGTDDGLLPTFSKHVLADNDAVAPMKLNKWETAVIETEIARDYTLAWYRIPSSSRSDSLGVPWATADGVEKILRPDFLVFASGDTGVTASIIDPHGTHLEDSIHKLRGLSNYAEQHGDQYARIESIALVDDTLRVLDHKDRRVRDAIRADGANTTALYADPSLSSWYEDL